MSIYKATQYLYISRLKKCLTSECGNKIEHHQSTRFVVVILFNKRKELCPILGDNWKFQGRS